MTTKALLDIRRKLRVLKYAKEIGNVSKPCPYNLTIRVPKQTEELIIYLRQTYHLGQQRIAWYLEPYHDIKVSSSGVYSVLCRNGLNRLPNNQRKRSMKQFKRYEKRVSGHRIQVDVKKLNI